MSGLNGKVINLLSFDTYRFDGLIPLVHYLWKGPIEVFVFGYFLYMEIGYYGWIGIGFILCFVPIQSESLVAMLYFFATNSEPIFINLVCTYSISVLMSKLTANYRYHLVNHSDARIRIINEIIQGIQTIKFYAWEKPFAKIVDQIRR